MKRTARETTLDPLSPFAGGACARAPNRLMAIYEIGRHLLEQTEPGQIIRAIKDLIVQHLTPEHACVLACEPDGSYRLLAAHNLDLGPTQQQWPLSRTALARAREDGLAVLATDTARDERFGAAGSVHRYRIRSVICVPLGQRPVRGLIYVDNRDSNRVFSREDLEFLTAVSLYATLVLERSEEYLRASQALSLTGERLQVLEEELLRYKIVGSSARLVAAFDALRRFARAGARVLLRGETGTGKELFARAFAASSGRSGKAYVPVPVPALAPTLVESELFGHVRGAFTEANRDKKGRLELSNGGVLFLDEVGDIQPHVQTKLLRFLDSGELFRVGDTEARHIDALVVSATNRALEKEVEQGSMRADLLARLGQVVTIPPLRDRPEDIPLLSEHFLDGHRQRGRKVLAPATLELMQRHRWPYNVRELKNVIERAVCLTDREVILPEDLPDEIRGPHRSAHATPSPAGPPAPPRPMREAIEELERDQIVKALEFTSGNKRRAIELLQVAPDTFYRRLEEFGLRKKHG